MQDLTKDVLRIDAIPATSVDSVREWLTSMDIKYYENKMNLNWFVTAMAIPRHL